MVSYKNDVRHGGYSLANQHAVLDDISEISETSERERERSQASHLHSRKILGTLHDNADAETCIGSDVNTETGLFTSSHKSKSDDSSSNRKTRELTEEEKEIKKYWYYALLALLIATLSWSIMGPSFVYLNRKGVQPIMAAAWRNVFIVAFVLVPASVEAYVSLTLNHIKSWIYNTSDEIEIVEKKLASDSGYDPNLDADNVSDNNQDILDATNSLNPNPNAPPSIHLDNMNPRLSNKHSHTIDITHTPRLTPSFGPNSLASMPLEDLSLDDEPITRSRTNSIAAITAAITNRNTSSSDETPSENSANLQQRRRKYFPILPTSTGSIWDRPITLLLLASIYWALSLSLWVTALRFTTTVIASLLCAIAPILLVIYYKIINVPVSRQESISVVVAFAGLILCLCSNLIVPGESRNNDGNEMAITGPFATIFGGFLCILSSLCVCFQAKYASRARRQIPVFAYTFAGTVCVCIFCLLFSVIVEGSRIFCRQNDCFFGFSHSDFIVQMLFLGFIGGWVGLVGFNFAVKYVSNVLYTVGHLMDPVLTSFVAFGLGYESLPKWPVYAGGGIVISGIIFLVLGETKRKEQEKLEAEAAKLAEKEAKDDLIAANLVAAAAKHVDVNENVTTTDENEVDTQYKNYDLYKSNTHERLDGMISTIDPEEMKTGQ